MEKQTTLFKGELMEELLRNYFSNLGFYTVRGVKFQYDGHNITDVDLFLYGRQSSLTRQRINVDIKNKKTPQAFERILWANGLMKLLKFDSCIVATTDQRPVIQLFGQLHDTIILDGAFLNKLKSITYPERLYEDELFNRLSNHKSYKTFNNKDWRFIYESSKSKLLTEMDFAGFNSLLSVLHYFIEKVLVDEQKREEAIRMLYIILSYQLIIIDFLIKDIAFLNSPYREKKLSDGFKFGNLGKDGVDKIISLAIQISGRNSANTFLKSLDEVPTEILRDFFGKNENSKNLFIWAKEFDRLAFERNLKNPEQIDSQLKGVISVLLDFFGVERRKFFEVFPKQSPQDEITQNKD